MFTTHGVDKCVHRGIRTRFTYRVDDVQHLLCVGRGDEIGSIVALGHLDHAVEQHLEFVAGRSADGKVAAHEEDDEMEERLRGGDFGG